MAQYIIGGFYETLRELTDGVDTFRVYSRPVLTGGGSMSAICIDQAITNTGFDGDENADWVCVHRMFLETDVGEGGAFSRMGVRDGYFVFDKAYEGSVDLFDGAEGWDWDNIDRHHLT